MMRIIYSDSKIFPDYIVSIRLFPKKIDIDSKSPLERNY